MKEQRYHSGIKFREIIPLNLDDPSTSGYHSGWPSNPVDESIVALSKDSKIKTEVKLHDVIHIDDEDKNRREIA